MNLKCCSVSSDSLTDVGVLLDLLFLFWIYLISILIAQMFLSVCSVCICMCVDVQPPPPPPVLPDTRCPCPGCHNRGVDRGSLMPGARLPSAAVM